MERLAAAITTSALTIAAVIGAGGSMPLFARGVIMTTVGSAPTLWAAAASISGIEGLVRVSTTITTFSPGLVAMYSAMTRWAVRATSMDLDKDASSIGAADRELGNGVAIG